ncbi:hypothetical protein BH09PAT2_BH09PAT2_06800 [soil metagenome]
MSLRMVILVTFSCAKSISCYFGHTPLKRGIATGLPCKVTNRTHLRREVYPDKSGLLAMTTISMTIRYSLIHLFINYIITGW